MEQPTVEELVSALGSVYGPSRPRPVVRNRSIGWSRSGKVDGAIGYVSLGFDVGEAGADVQVETRSDMPDPRGTALLLALDKLPRNGEPRFPIRRIVTREERKLAVDGRGVLFHVYSCGGRSEALTALGKHSLRVMMKSRQALRFLQFESLPAETLSEHVGPPRPSTFPPDWRPPRVNWPTARDVTRAFPHGVLGLAGRLGANPHPTAGWDHSGNAVSNVHLFRFPSSSQNPITVRTTHGASATAEVLRALLTRRHQTLRKGLAFPLDLSISRELTSIVVDDRPTPVLVFTCGPVATAVGTHDLSAFTLECSRRQLNALSLRTVNSTELSSRFRRK